MVINRAAVGWVGHVLPSVCFVFSFVGYKSQTSADDVIISQLQAISQLLSSYLPSGEFCLVSELNKIAVSWGGFMWSKLGQNPSEMHVKAFPRIKNVT